MYHTSRDILRQASSYAKDRTKTTLKSLLEKYPALENHAESGPSIPEKNDEPATIVDNLLDDSLLSSVEQLVSIDEFLSSLYMKVTDTSIHSEQKVVNFVITLLEAILTALKLFDFIRVVQNRFVAGEECDVLLVYQPSNLPFATIEVKKPSNIPDERRQVFGGNRSFAGQIFDEMTALKLFGFKRVYGMITMGNHWQLFSTDKSKKELNLTAFWEKFINKMQGSKKTEILEAHGESSVEVSPERNFEDSTPGQFSGQTNVRVLENLGPDQETKRQVFGSQIIPDLMLNETNAAIYRSKVEQSGQEILQMITTFVLMACSSLSDFLHDNGSLLEPYVFRTDEAIPCRVLMKDETRFPFSSVRLTEKIEFWKYNPRLVYVYVIRPLGSGEHGSACLAISKSGKSCCVVKFFHDLGHSEKLANNELENWNLVYGQQNDLPMSRVRKYPHGFCLIMPYLPPVNKQDRILWLRNGKIQTALKNFASTGCTHGDVRWRHFGLWKGNLFLIDLGSIKTGQTPSQIETWCKISLEHLTASAVEKQVPSFSARKRSRRDEEMFD
jgi:hypothetical protein